MGCYALAQTLVVHGLLQLVQHLVGAFHDARRHSRQPCHVDAEAVGTASRLQAAQEDDLAIHLPHAYVEVLDACELGFHLVQFVVVCGEERAGVPHAVLMDILHNGPRDAYAVVGAGAAPQFVEEHK